MVVPAETSLFYTETLSNGLQMLGEYMPSAQSAACVFYVQTGARDEAPEHMGVSHFLEHMAFRGNERRSSEAIDRAFEEMGADSNAATSLEMTYYWARVLSENVSWAIDVLCDLTHPALSADMFNQERNVILEEIARGDDSPGRVLFTHFMSDFFRDHPLSRDVLGTEQTISNLPVEAMRSYWADRYGTKNMIFAIAGNFDWESVRTQLQALSAHWQQGTSGRVTSPAAFRPGLHVVQRETFTQEQVLLGTPSVGRCDPRYYTAALLTTILGDDTGSRLFWALHETGLAESATASTYELEDNGVLMVHIATEPDKTVAALQATRAEMALLQDGGVQEAELERAKVKLNSSEVIGGENPNVRVMSLIHSWLTEGRLESLGEIRHKIDAVKVEDIAAYLRDFPIYPRQVITAVGPLAESDVRAGVE